MWSACPCSRRRSCCAKPGWPTGGNEAVKHLAQHRSGFRHLWWLVALLVLLMATYVVAGRQLMQVVPHWRAPLQELLQKRTGLPLTIGGLSGRMEGLTPVLQLDQLVVPAG